jgi:response regulator RpfG family c-di-GMP phosphodiesterase
MNREDIIESVKQAAVHQFDPKVVRAFLEVMPQEDREGGI